MIIVTGGAGFIGSNIVRGLNQRGERDIIVVDDLSDGHKYKNLVHCDIADYWDKNDFLRAIQNDLLTKLPISAVFHQGACATTTEWNGEFMMKNNYQYSKELLQFCLQKKAQFIYASSAAVYGNGTVFKESREYETPINVYGYSKFQFDQYVRNLIRPQTQIVGATLF